MTKSAIIIGAGVIGVCSAYALARRGWRVQLVERENGPALKTSHANGAQLSYCYTEALGSPSTLAALPHLLGGRGGVSFGLGFSPSYLSWLATFARNCSPSRFRRNTLEVLELAQQSALAMERLCEVHDFDFSHRVAGKIHLLYNEKDIRRALKVRKLKGLDKGGQDIVLKEQFSQLDPALAWLDPDAIAAVSTPSEIVGDPYVFCRNMVPILERDYGVETRFGASIAKVDETAGGAIVTLEDGEELSGNVAVVCAGVWSNHLLANLGQKQPIQPMKGYSFEMPITRRSPRISVTDGKRRIVFTHLGDRMRVAGIAELGNGSEAIDKDRMDWMIDAARDCLPEGGDYERITRHWTGVRPATPNSQPIIKRVRQSIAVNAGHGALGWTLAMGSGERLARLLEGEPV